jgi:hypothetical protein
MTRMVVEKAMPASHSSEEVVTFVYDCKWMVPIVLGDQFDPGQSLSDVVTLTGKFDQVQAASCSEYVSQF